MEPVETWPSMERAAEQRFLDGLALATGDPGREAGAIYLLGYVAEMLIKTAHFRTIGVPANQDIAPVLRAVRNHSLWTGRNLHDLRSWIDFLIDVRQLQGKPISPPTAGIIRQQVLTVDAHWRETLRYTSQTATAVELNEVFDSVEWLHDNYALLWR